MANQRMLDSLLTVLQILLFLLSTTICATKIPNGLSLKMIHRDSPNSPMYRANLTDKERMKEYNEMSTARVRSLASLYVHKNKSLRSLSHNDVIITPPLSEQSFSYVVQVGIGTFLDEHPTSRTYHLGFDTGSNLIWTQCEGCEHCFHQIDPYFPSTRSSTYQPYPCSRCPPETPCAHNGCVVERTYIDGATVRALSAKEVFTFASECGRTQSIPDIIFGCGFDMQNFDEGDNHGNKISGTMGMGYGFFGFMEQTQLIFDGKFSYCLQPIFSEERSSPMYLRFGNDVLPQPTIKMQSTPLYRYGDISMYYLNLQGISVDGQGIASHPIVFAFKSDGSGGCVIDSGTVTSWIASEAYTVFERVVIDFIKQNNKNLRKMKTPEMGFNLCFDRYKRPVTMKLPVITYHFENNANYVIEDEDAFYITTTPSGRDIACLQFYESTPHQNNDVTYLGAVHQVNKRIIYDTKNSWLHFAPADCSHEN